MRSYPDPDQQLVTSHIYMEMTEEKLKSFVCLVPKSFMYLFILSPSSLSIPASAATSESIFRETGRILDRLFFVDIRD